MSEVVSVFRSGDWESLWPDRTESVGTVRWQVLRALVADVTDADAGHDTVCSGPQRSGQRWPQTADGRPGRATLRDGACSGARRQ